MFKLEFDMNFLTQLFSLSQQVFNIKIQILITKFWSFFLLKNNISNINNLLY